VGSNEASKPPVCTSRQPANPCRWPVAAKLKVISIVASSWPSNTAGLLLRCSRAPTHHGDGDFDHRPYRQDAAPPYTSCSISRLSTPGGFSTLSEPEAHSRSGYSVVWCAFSARVSGGVSASVMNSHGVPHPGLDSPATLQREAAPSRTSVACWCCPAGLCKSRFYPSLFLELGGFSTATLDRPRDASRCYLELSHSVVLEMVSQPGLLVV